MSAKMAQAPSPDPIDGGDVGALNLSHEAIDAAYSRRIAELWDVLMRDAKVHHDKLTPEARARFTAGYRLAARARIEAHKLIDEITI